jgi:hypothetical protein
MLVVPEVTAKSPSAPVPPNSSTLALFAIETLASEMFAFTMEAVPVGTLTIANGIVAAVKAGYWGTVAAVPAIIVTAPLELATIKSNLFKEA